LSGAKAGAARAAWANQVFHTLTTNRARLARIDATGHQASDVAPIPQWAWNASRLPEFSSATYEDWTAVMKVMIVDQLPEFDLHPDWKPIVQRSSSRTSARSEILAGIARGLAELARSQVSA
jgi:hypothetical protein